MTTPTPPQPNTGDERLRAAILKASTVRYATGSFTQKLYSNDTASPIEHKVQEIVEIGINDLMDLVKAELGAARLAEAEEILKVAFENLGPEVYFAKQRLEGHIEILRNHFGIGEDV